MRTTQQVQKTTNKEAGVTLMELIAALAVMAVIIVGALSLYNSATSSQASTQLIQDVTALRSAVKQLWMGQGTYGTASLNATLIKANRIPTTIITDAATGTLTHSLNGTITVTGATTQFTVELTNIPIAVCVSLMTSAQGWVSVDGPGSATAATPPVTPTAAAADCDATGKVTFTGN